MPRKRISAAERRAKIITAARRVFSQVGYDGAKTLQIAQAAKISEALIYRHFPSKLALYRAVLRQVFLEQDERWNEQGIHGGGTEGLASAIHAYIAACARDGGDREHRDTNRLTLASLAGDGSYASLIYRRAQRRNQAAMNAAYAEARAEGGLVGPPLDTASAGMFVEHVGTMMSAIGGLPAGARPYGVTGEELVDQATRFCLRGIGMPDEAITAYFAAVAGAGEARLPSDPPSADQGAAVHADDLTVHPPAVLR